MLNTEIPVAAGVSRLPSGVQHSPTPWSERQLAAVGPTRFATPGARCLPNTVAQGHLGASVHTSHIYLDSVTDV